MLLLRNFFDDFSKNNRKDFPQEWKFKTGVVINDQPLSSFFACEVHASPIFDHGDDEDSIPEYSLYARNFYDLFSRLGIPDLNFQKENYEAELISDEKPIGWALWYRDVKFARHAVFEIGDDEHHIRIDMKDCFNGSPFRAQIDQILIWDRHHRYQVPLSVEGDYMLPYVEDIIGTVDIATQALDNGDDEQAYLAFKDMHRIIDELRLGLSDHNFSKLSVTHNTP